MTGPIVKTVTVPLSPERAFTLFTEEMSDWWPLDTHSLSAGDGETAKSVTVTPEEGGAVFETKPDGSTAQWGRVTEWDPGRAFGMTWHVGRPEDQASHVHVSFDVVADGTKVTLIHDNWRALGAEAASLRQNYHSGWDTVFCALYAGAAQSVMVTAA
ncbi:SRPBCC domain-containing protein [Pseudoruegeria sp. HB172150]|uniref:SRPBCC domain-containing protein n=1 Tax=Pseudoruegeria sp. HB172150 TaxID=2721164 RepID=UPI00155748D7|nr:SRPBCC domain-containing protein [Pseudoruegeria sp. HB172150]